MVVEEEDEWEELSLGHLRRTLHNGSSGRRYGRLLVAAA